MRKEGPPAPNYCRSAEAFSMQSSDRSLLNNAVLADTLKTLEAEMLRRGMLHSPGSELVRPLWFLAETERNIFLWREGLSLCEADDYEFWIDPLALIKKRSMQLQANEPDNPFINPLWGSLEPICAVPDVESKYLKDFRLAFEKLAIHALALSQAISRVQQEQAACPQILLPQKIAILP